MVFVGDGNTSPYSSTILPLSMFFLSQENTTFLQREEHVSNAQLLISASLIPYFFLFRATLVAYISSKTRGQIGDAAPAYTTATATPDMRHI